MTIGEQTPRIRGLATLALLKSLYDTGTDHIGMFLPLLLEAIRSGMPEAFSVDQCRTAFRDTHGISVANPTMQTVLNRAVRKKYLHRNGGRYFPGAKQWPDLGIPGRMRAIQDEQLRLASKLIEYAVARGRKIECTDEALSLLLQFLEENQISIILDDEKNLRLTPPPSLSERDSSIVAAFMMSVCLPDETLNLCLRNMLEGFVLQNALLLADIGSIPRKCLDIEVYLDTRFLLGAIGLQGEESQRLAKETLELLKAAGARLSVFTETCHEMRRVFHMYERHLGTSDGILSLRPGPMTSFLLMKRCSPSDLRQEDAMLDGTLRAMGITLRALPAHRPQSTLDESDLAKRMGGSGGHDDIQPRIEHDVACTAAILTLRNGETADKLQNVRVAFATTTGEMVRTVSSWYRDQGQAGIPPVINIFTLACLAALRQPAAAPDLPIHQIVALCCAALHPSRQLWSQFTLHLRHLVEDRKITSDEAVAIVADDLTGALLAELEQELPAGGEDRDALTIQEVVERVRVKHSAEGKAMADAASRSAAAQLQAVQERAEARAEAAERMAAAERDRYDRIGKRWRGFAELASSLISWLIFIGISFCALSAGVFGLVGTALNVKPGHIGWIIVGVGTLVAVYCTVAGTSVGHWRQRVQDRIACGILRLALGSGQENNPTDAGDYR